MTDLEKEAAMGRLRGFLSKLRAGAPSGGKGPLLRLPGSGRRAAEVAQAAAVTARKRRGTRVTRTFAAGVSHPDKERTLRGYRSQAMREGINSLALFPVQYAAEKVIGRGKVRRALWHAAGRPALEADTAVGHVLSKLPGVGGAFRVKEKVPWGKGLYREIERSSALGPLAKARDVSEPILVGVGLEKGIRKATEIAKRSHEDQVDSGHHIDDHALRTKVASTMLRLDAENRGHVKRAQAIRLLYKQAEMGVAQLPQTYSELEEKLASLVNEDLAVFEKALELTGGSVKLGNLDRPDPYALDAAEQFQAAILGDDT